MVLVLHEKKKKKGSKGQSQIGFENFACIILY